MKKYILFPLCSMTEKFENYFMNKVRIRMLKQVLIVINNYSFALAITFFSFALWRLLSLSSLKFCN